MRRELMESKNGIESALANLIQLSSEKGFLVFDDIQPGKFFLYLTDGFHFHFSSFSAAGHSRVILPILPERKSSNNTRAALA